MRSELPTTIEEVFLPLCQELSPEACQELLKKVLEKQDDLEMRFTEALIGPDLKLVQTLREGCEKLLERYADLTSQHRALAIGAVQYFLAAKDSISDETALRGFDDDVLVFNFVAQRLGRNELKILIEE